MCLPIQMIISNTGGIKGQKWGIRRYQNKDGSLTPEGIERYGSVENLTKDELFRIDYEKDMANYYKLKDTRNEKKVAKLTNKLSSKTEKYGIDSEQAKKVSEKLDKAMQKKKELDDLIEFASKRISSEELTALKKAYNQRLAREIIADLGALGLGIVSGLTTGVYFYPIPNTNFYNAVEMAKAYTKSKDETNESESK